jgi:hypothetical protein
MLTTNRTGYFAGRVNFTTSSISIRGIQTWFLFVLEAVKGSVRVLGKIKRMSRWEFGGGFDEGVCWGVGRYGLSRRLGERLGR